MAQLIPLYSRVLFVSLLTIASFRASAATETMLSGSFIVNMGVTPQTYSNGLKPYGLIYDLIENYAVPIKWVIEPTKAKDGTGFTYNGTDYKGGPFIIPSEYISASVQTRITYWVSQGVVGVYTTADISVPVYVTLTSFPNIMIDDASASVITPYFTNAAIPSSSYLIGLPADVDNCDDYYSLPHADPEWSTHEYLYDFLVNQKGYLWVGCHAISMIEGIKDPDPPYTQFNFLTTAGLKCYSSNDCGDITEDHNSGHTNPVSYPTGYGAEPIMQFMGNMHGATDNGSERWYIPISTGSWRSTTKRPVITSDGTYPGEGAKLAYGPAYGNSSYGYVMYEGGHRHTTGGTTDQTAAQRVFFNYGLLSAQNKAPAVNGNVAAQILSGTNYNFTASVSGGTAPYTYAWTKSCGGTLSPTNAQTTQFTPPSVASPTTCTITVMVTDACGRTNFSATTITIYPPGSILPVDMISFTANLEEDQVLLEWTTAREELNDHFDIERMVAGESEFRKIGEVAGAGTTNKPTDYNYIDEVSGLEGTVYYRLRQVDMNGSFHLTPSEKVLLSDNSSGPVTIFPNPTGGTIYIQLPGNELETIYVKLFNALGQVGLEQTLVKHSGDQNQFSLDVSGLPEGMWYLSIFTGKETFDRPLMINRF